jgi:spore germination cell wall hydrolase CwlJ-like protein
MATQRTSFTKLQRDRAKKAKAAAKRERRQERAAEAKEHADDESSETPTEGPISAAELLHEIEVTHQRYEAKLMSYEEFEEKKAELLARLPID